jgi:hypothetical protein
MNYCELSVWYKRAFALCGNPASVKVDIWASGKCWVCPACYDGLFLYGVDQNGVEVYTQDDCNEGEE